MLRAEAARRGTVLLSLWMYVVRKFEEGIDDCHAGCVSCNERGVHAWDEGVALYTGSLVGADGRGGAGAGGSWEGGELLYTLANEQCAHFHTCAPDGNSRVNAALLPLFTDGKRQLSQGRTQASGMSSCSTAREELRRIVDLMTVPLLQGALRSAYQLAHLSGGPRERGAAAAFAAAVLPRLAHCDAEAASRVAASLTVGAASITPNFEAVKAAFESNYGCLNVTCADVGGLWDPRRAAGYYAGFEPCRDADPPPPTPLWLPTAPWRPGPASLRAPPSAPAPVGGFTAGGIAFISASAVVLGVSLLSLLHLLIRKRRRIRQGEIAARNRDAASISMEQLRIHSVARAVGKLPRRVAPATEAEAGASAHECAVCLGAFVAGEELRQLPCGHEFHL